jgi:hypothetical protein
MRLITTSAISLLVLSSLNTTAQNTTAQNTTAEAAQDAIKLRPLILPMAAETPKPPSAASQPSDQKIQPIQVEPAPAKPIPVPEYKKAKKEKSYNPE